MQTIQALASSAHETASPAASPADASSKLMAVCPHDCPDTCALQLTVQAGKVIHVTGHPDHPPTGGAICTKVSRYAERSYSPERVLTPLKRVGGKGPGKGRFEPVGWEQALSAIATRLKAIAARDPQAIAPYSYAGTMGLVQGEAMAGRFFNRLGGSRLLRTICSQAGFEGLIATYGAAVGMTGEHFHESRLILIWGSNPITSSVHFWNQALQAKRAGAKLIAIDPRKSETAERCHQHIALLPGTDGALALGLMHQLIVNDWLDHGYINQHVEGWPALREKAMAWPPERVATECGITADEVRGLARDYGRVSRECAATGAGPAAIRLNYGMQRVRGGGNAVRLIALLPCLVGAWRHRAGGVLLTTSGWFRHARNDAWLQKPELLAGRNPRSINMSTIGDDLLREASPAFGPKIEALIVYNSNPVAIAPESAKVVQGFARPDLFTVVLEHFQTDTADYADYLLPATTQLEHWDAHRAYGHLYAMLNRPAVAPVGQALSNAEIFRRLAAHMGYTEPCFSESDEALARGAFNAQEVNFAQLERKGWQRLQVADAPFAQGGFPTPSGKAMAVAPGLGVADYVPNYESANTSPDLAARYPLAFISPPARHFLNSSFVNIPSLVASMKADEREPLLEIHPQDAAPRSLVNGDTVRVFNGRGSYVCKAQVSERARPGVVNGLGIWWRKQGLDGTNVNELTHQRLTDLGAGPSFYDCLVQVEKHMPGQAQEHRLGQASSHA